MSERKPAKPRRHGTKKSGVAGDAAGETSADVDLRHAKTARPSRAESKGARETDAATQPKSLIREPLSVRWRDLDAFNHVNNSKFLSYLEEARLRWMMSIPGPWLDDDVAPVVAAAHINFRRPIEWPNEILVELFVESLGSSSLSIGHCILSASDDAVLYADGNVVMVWIDRQHGKAAPLPPVVRHACGEAAAD